MVGDATDCGTGGELFPLTELENGIESVFNAVSILVFKFVIETLEFQ
jgi:hypothetical protein